MTPKEFVTLTRVTLLDIAAAGRIPIDPLLIPDPVTMERPCVREHGDWVTSVAVQLGRKAGMAPREFTQIFADDPAAVDGTDSVEVAGPDFINIRLSAGAADELAHTIVEAGATYGRNETFSGRSINPGYVSANPTGPVHLGGTHWVAVGDFLARSMAASGAAMAREYYFNDHGSQIDRFSHSLYARATDREVPEDGCGGQYIADIADQVRADACAVGELDPITLPEEETIEAFRARGVELMFVEIKERLHLFRADFNVFSHEESLYTSGAVVAAIERLCERGEVFDEGGAVWLCMTTYGDDKDRVPTKSDGQAAYFAGDIAYYLNRHGRGTDVAIYLLGAGHHGYIARTMTMCVTFGDKPGENLQILTGQLVNFVKDGEPVRMSKRVGTTVTFDDPVDAVGADAARYALVRVSMDTQVDIDLDLPPQHPSDNPVHYVQYAHVRACDVACNAAERGVTRDAGFDPATLDPEVDEALLAALAQFPTQVAQVTELREPCRITRYLEPLAATYHAWYGQYCVTPRGDDPVESGHITRPWLNDAATQVLCADLGPLGVSAPERM